MINVLDISLSPTATVKDALKLIDYGLVKIALIVDQQQHLLGTLNDGDIRRGLLRKKTLNDPKIPKDVSFNINKVRNIKKNMVTIQYFLKKFHEKNIL